MKQYNVTVNVNYVAVVTVEAADEEAAYEQVLDMEYLDLIDEAEPMGEFYRGDMLAFPATA